MNFYNEIPRLIIDAAKYFWSNLGSHYSDLHTCILSLASVSNINLAAMVKENPMRFQQQTHLSLLLEIINNTWFPPVIKIIISILSSICYRLKIDFTSRVEGAWLESSVQQKGNNARSMQCLLHHQ